MRRYTQEEKQFLREHVPGHSYKETLEAFAERFEPMTFSQLKSYINNNKLKTGRSGKFKPGNVPHNKGHKMPEEVRKKCEKTMFKPGEKPQTMLPIGTEIRRADNYTYVKVSDRTWKLKHHLIWEQANGPIPEGHKVIFLNRDTECFDLENLALVSNAELVRMNVNHLVTEDRELTKQGVAVAKLMGVISKRERNENGKKNTEVI